MIQAIAEDDDIPAVLIVFSQTGFAGPTTVIYIAKVLKALRDNLPMDLYNAVRITLGLDPLSIAVPAGTIITDKIKKTLA